MWKLLVLKRISICFFLKAAEEDSGTETDDETGGPDEGKPNKHFFWQVQTSLDKFGQFQTNYARL